MHLELEIRKKCKLDKFLPCHWKTGQIFMSLLVALHKCYLISIRSCAHLPDSGRTTMPFMPNFPPLKVQLSNLEVVKYPEGLESRNYGVNLARAASLQAGAAWNPKNKRLWSCQINIHSLLTRAAQLTLEIQSLSGKGSLLVKTKNIASAYNDHQNPKGRAYALWVEAHRKPLWGVTEAGNLDWRQNINASCQTGEGAALQRFMSDDEGGRNFCIYTTMHFINEIELDGQNAATDSQHPKIYQLSTLGTESVNVINWLQMAVVSTFHGSLFITTGEIIS